MIVRNNGEKERVSERAKVVRKRASEGKGEGSGTGRGN